jgi:hypothetical protein
MMLDNYKVPEKELRVSVGFSFDAANLDSQTSATDSSHKGIKAKKIHVSLLLPYEESQSLSELTAIAEATRDDGSLKIYDITEHAANAMKVRQVRFTDSFNVRDDYSLLAWQVNFTLQEYQSVPEKVEQRQAKVVAGVQQAAGQVVGGDAATDSTEAQPKGSFEKILANIDSMLAPAATNETT